MLKALESGKLRGLVLAGLREGVERQHLLEDLLSATVLGRVRYFPDKTIALLMGTLLGGNCSLGQLKRFEFWPRYPVPGESCDVEPDAILEFDSAVVIIEAKRVDGVDMHSDEQLRRQLKAVSLAFQSEAASPVSIYGIALGGHRQHASAPILEGAWQRVSWAKLYETIQQLPEDGTHSNRLKSDISLAFLLHGVRVRDPEFFDSLKAPTILRTALDSWPVPGRHRFQTFHPAGIKNSSFPAWA